MNLSLSKARNLHRLTDKYIEYNIDVTELHSEHAASG